MSVYFDSKDPRCKSPFGAVLCGTEVSFAVFFGPEDGILGGELQVREEFAGVLTPQIWPGPVTRAHPGRFAPRERRKADDIPGTDDNGIWTRDGV